MSRLGPGEPKAIRGQSTVDIQVDFSRRCTYHERVEPYGDGELASLGRQPGHPRMR